MPDGTHTADYDYELPPELVASVPLDRRDASRMLVVDRASGRIEHRHFAEFPDLLQPGDLCLLNDSRVRKARVFTDDGKIEFFFLDHLGGTRWHCLTRPGKKTRPGDSIAIAGVRATIVAAREDGSREVELDGAIDFERHGHVPIPPYMHREDNALDSERYQTVFAREEGSVAAPTAGLHFTPGVLARIPHAFITLHVGTGTFLPVKADLLADHRMHQEHFSIPHETATRANAASRLVAIGTTATRVLESRPPGPLDACSGATDIFIHPPYAPRRAGALLTNFHLPKSTLLMLVCAFAGRKLTLSAYGEAIRERYRFFSYGDCMLVL